MFQPSVGVSVRMNPAKSRANTMRDGALKAAAQKLKAAMPSNRVQEDFKQRVVKVDDQVAFQQQPGDLSGYFIGQFSNLSI